MNNTNSTELSKGSFVYKVEELYPDVAAEVENFRLCRYEIVKLGKVHVWVINRSAKNVNSQVARRYMVREFFQDGIIYSSAQSALRGHMDKLNDKIDATLRAFMRANEDYRDFVHSIGKELFDSPSSR